VVFTNSSRTGTRICIFKEPDWELDSCMEPKLKLELELELGFLEKKTKNGGLTRSYRPGYLETEPEVD
jgi:hypothetical protein